MGYLGTKPGNQVVTSAQIADGAVITQDIADSAVTTVKIADSAVTPAKLSQKLTQGVSVASTSGAAIDFTSIPSWVKRITVMFNGVSTNGGSIVQVQIGSGSVVSTGYSGGSILFIGSPGIATGAVTTGFACENSSGSLTASTVRFGSMQLLLQTGNTWIASGNFVHTGTATGGMTGGSLALGGTLDRIRITTVNGTDTFDAGSINILYEG